MQNHSSSKQSSYHLLIKQFYHNLLHLSNSQKIALIFNTISFIDWQTLAFLKQKSNHLLIKQSNYTIHIFISPHIPGNCQNISNIF